MLWWSIKSSQTNFLIAYSDYKSSGCISAPTAECLMAKALITAQNNCSSWISGENEKDRFFAAIYADLARTAIIINDTTIKDEIISNIAEKIFDDCIVVTNFGDVSVNVPYLLKPYINHKMSVSKPDQAREKLKFLNGSHKLEAIYSILNKSLNEKTFKQLESFIEKDDSLNSEKFKMSLVLLKMAYETNYKPPTKFLLNAANLKYDPNNEMVRGAGLLVQIFFQSMKNYL